jgi:arginine exporter protein ArgO
MAFLTLSCDFWEYFAIVVGLFQLIQMICLAGTVGANRSAIRKPSFLAKAFFISWFFIFRVGGQSNAYGGRKTIEMPVEMMWGNDGIAVVDL